MTYFISLPSVIIIPPQHLPSSLLWKTDSQILTQDTLHLSYRWVKKILSSFSLLGICSKCPNVVITKHLIPSKAIKGHCWGTWTHTHTPSSSNSGRSGVYQELMDCALVKQHLTILRMLHCQNSQCVWRDKLLYVH